MINHFMKARRITMAERAHIENCQAIKDLDSYVPNSNIAILRPGIDNEYLKAMIDIIEEVTVDEYSIDYERAYAEYKNPVCFFLDEDSRFSVTDRDNRVYEMTIEKALESGVLMKTPSIRFAVYCEDLISWYNDNSFDHKMSTILGRNIHPGDCFNLEGEASGLVNILKISAVRGGNFDEKQIEEVLNSPEEKLIWVCGGK